VGTPLEITGHDGTIAWSVDYHAYGNVARERVQEITSPLRFQGQYYDEETGLHYNRHRYYSPETGRYITVDPIGLAGGLNNYLYVVNPTGWVDPLGLAQCPGSCPSAARRTYLNEKFDRVGDLNNDINIRSRKETAFNFYKSQGFDEVDIPSHLNGIDFTQPVDVVTLNRSKKLFQYQTRGAPQGNYYTLSEDILPTHLGISPNGFNRELQISESKIRNKHVTKGKANVLKSKAASVVDFWSVQGEKYVTEGGGPQLFSADKNSFKLQD
jgi:RHS repeat-associated protein